MYRPGDYLMAQNAMKQLSEEQFGSDVPVSDTLRWWEKFGLMFQRREVVIKESNQPSLTLAGREPLKNRL